MPLSKPDWLDAYINPDPKPPEEAVQLAYDWMRTRPESVKKTMLKFPPSSVVRIIKQRGVYLPFGAWGLITIYHEDGDVGIRFHPDSDKAHKITTEQLELMAYYEGLSPEKVKEILDG